MDKSLFEHYAYALFSLSKDENKAEEYSKERRFLALLFEKNPDFLTFLSSPRVSSFDKEKVRKDALDPNLSKAVSGFIRIRGKRNALKHFAQIEAAYQHLYNEEKGILEGRIYSAYLLDDTQRKELESAFSDQYRKTVVFRQFVDKSLIGGRKIYVGDTLYDNSIDSRLEAVRQTLLKQKA